MRASSTADTDSNFLRTTPAPLHPVTARTPDTQSGRGINQAPTNVARRKNFLARLTEASTPLTKPDTAASPRLQTRNPLPSGPARIVERRKGWRGWESGWGLFVSHIVHAGGGRGARGAAAVGRRCNWRALIRRNCPTMEVGGPGRGRGRGVRGGGGLGATGRRGLRK